MRVTGTDLDLALRDPKSFLYQWVMHAIDKESFDLMTILKLVQENYEQRVNAERHERAAHESLQAHLADQVAKDIFKDKTNEDKHVMTAKADASVKGESLAGLQGKLNALNTTIESLNDAIIHCNDRLTALSTHWNHRQKEAANAYVEQSLYPQLEALQHRDSPVVLPDNRPLPPPPPFEKLVKAVTRVSPVQLYNANPNLLEKPVERLLHFGDVMAELRLKATMLGKSSHFASDCLSFNQQVKGLDLPKHTKADEHDFVNARTVLAEKRNHENELSVCEHVKAAVMEAIAHHHTPTPKR